MNVAIIIYFFLVGFILRGSIIAFEAYMFSEPVFKRARHLIPLSLIIAAG